MLYTVLPCHKHQLHVKRDTCQVFAVKMQLAIDDVTMKFRKQSNSVSFALVVIAISLPSKPTVKYYLPSKN